MEKGEVWGKGREGGWVGEGSTYIAVPSLSVDRRQYKEPMVNTEII